MQFAEALRERDAWSDRTKNRWYALQSVPEAFFNSRQQSQRRDSHPSGVSPGGDTHTHTQTDRLTGINQQKTKRSSTHRQDGHGGSTGDAARWNVSPLLSHELCLLFGHTRAPSSLLGWRHLSDDAFRRGLKRFIFNAFNLFILLHPLSQTGCRIKCLHF